MGIMPDRFNSTSAPDVIVQNPVKNQLMDWTTEAFHQQRLKLWLADELAAMCGGTSEMWIERAEKGWPHGKSTSGRETG